MAIVKSCFHESFEGEVETGKCALKILKLSTEDLHVSRSYGPDFRSASESAEKYSK